MMPYTALFGIIGHPLAHSMSPALHNWAFSRAGIAGFYMAWPLQPEKLPAFFDAARALPVRGGNITLPHKVTSMALLDGLSPRAQRVGAINTFYWDDACLCGDNTDVAGFLDPLAHRRILSALVLGAGGASRAVLAGLKELEVPDIGVSNRTAGKAETLAEEFGVHHVPWDDRTSSGADCIINATTQGMAGEGVDNTPLPARAFRGKGLAYDIVYNPLETRFLREAGVAGWDTQDGLAMFVGQARESFRLWHRDKDMPAREAAALVKRLLAADV
ncbi:MAG: shikimate dehydrogenase [Desulfovibrio sp.]|jgi:shikimate dehydrogenase|nr:shikimate dehydrogenase [Desulfovibrio sp.]